MLVLVSLSKHLGTHSMLTTADYKKSKSEDIMSFMLTLFEQADFIKEVQSLLGERLLSVGYDNTELEKEVSVWFGQLSLS